MHVRIERPLERRPILEDAAVRMRQMQLPHMLGATTLVDPENRQWRFAAAQQPTRGVRTPAGAPNGQDRWPSGAHGTHERGPTDRHFGKQLGRWYATVFAQRQDANGWSP